MPPDRLTYRRCEITLASRTLVEVVLIAAAVSSALRAEVNGKLIESEVKIKPNTYNAGDL